MVLKNIIEHIIGVFKNHFQYFKASRHYLPLSTQVNKIYALAAVHNFININNLNNLLNNNLEVKDKVIDEDDIALIEAESNIVIN